MGKFKTGDNDDGAVGAVDAKHHGRKSKKRSKSKRKQKGRY